MAVEHTFLGTWEIISCTFEGKPEVSGLEGMKFRLDDSSDITWYNDLVSPQPESKDCNTCCDSASVLFSCESFDVNESNPRLIFGAFAGHSIEFKTNTLTPTDTLVLDCENWYALECKRLKEGHAAGQEKEFSFAEPLTECYFSDVIIKSSDGLDYRVHSSVLRLSGFDCSMCAQPLPTPSTTSCKVHEATKKHCERSCSDARTPKAIKISVTIPSTTVDEHQKSLPRLNLSPIYLQPPTECSPRGGGGGGDLSVHRTHQLSSSFNCLPITATTTTTNSELHVGVGDHGGNRNCGLGNMRRFPPFTSSSDSHLETSQDSHSKNIFNFCQDMVLSHTIEPPSAPVCNTRRPPLSPYRARSPSPFPSSAMDTPPSSPLTPVGVLNNLPAFILTPILHWIYTESLMPDMDEDVCEKLINFAETQPSLTRMVTPTKKYLELIILKKFVVNIIMDLHSILNRTTQTINPVAISHEPHLLYATFKDCLRDCAIGCAKVLQFCNIFIKEASDISRYQKNEIIKYVRAHIPLFMTQFHQLLKNVLNVFISLDEHEKLELVDYLVPEIESILSTLTSLVEEIKNSLEKMCKDLKCSHLDLSMQQKSDDAATVFQFKNHTFIAASAIEVQETSLSIFGQPPPQSPRLQRPAPRRAGLTLYADNPPPDKQRLMSTENDLKFVLYMYEVRKMRDIYGRIAAALDIIRDKKTTFCEMDLPSKRSTIQQNLEQLIQDMPSYIFIMENLSDSLDEKLGRKEFKFCFKLATSQINGVIVKLFDHKAALKDAINQICKLVKKREFTQSIIDLGLLEHSNILQNEIKSADDNQYNRAGGKSGNWDLNGIETRRQVCELSLIENLCEPPTAANSNLSKNALRLLHSAQLTDMEFEVHTVTSSSSSSVSQPIPGNTVAAFAKDELAAPQIRGGQTIAATAQQPAVHIHTFRAHRVIVSSRCEWFKMALLSGMKESFTRKIIITDTSPVIFRRLLLYLYGAPIDKTVGAEQICELMLLADRYSIDDLKTLCENTLNTLIDEESVVCLLGIAERYRADVLKNNCFVFLQQHASITRLEIFKELPRSIQLEAKDRIHWYQRAPEPWGDGFKSRSGSRHSLKSPSKPRSRSRKSSPSYI